MSAVVVQWVQHIGAIFQNARGSELAASFPLEPRHPFWKPLSDASALYPPGGLKSEIVTPYLGVIPADIRETLTSFILAELDYVRIGRSSSGDSSESAQIAQFQALNTVYLEANRLYAAQGSDGNYSYPFLNLLILSLARTLAQVGRHAAQFSSAPARSAVSARSIRDTTRQTIEKSFQVAASGYTDGEWAGLVGREWVVGDVVWALANVLWRIYAERNLHTQAMEIIRSISTLTPREDRRLQTRGYGIRQTDLCQSYYWRGRIRLILMEFRDAKNWLDRAWSICPEDAWQQKRAILIKLIPVNLLVGRLPSPQLLEQYNLPQFLPLIQAYRTGNIPAWRAELDKNREWYRSRSIWLILYERGELLVWRNLLRQSLKAYYQLNPDKPRNRCPTWVFVEAVKTAFEGSGEIEAEAGGATLEDIICVVSSLIDQGFILGQLSYSQLILILKPSPDGMGGFPPISKVTPRVFQANA